MSKNASPGLRLMMVLIIAAAMFLYLYPLFYLFNISLKLPNGYLANPISLTHSFDFQNYWNAWVKGNFGKSIINSILYVTLPTFASLIITVLAAFPVARGYVRSSGLWYSFFMMALFLPYALIPQFYLVLQLKMYNTMWGYMLLKTTGAGLGLMILTGFIKTIPRELDDAAAMDGCGYFRYIFAVITPLVKPALVTAGIFQTISTWNDIISPTVYLADESKFPMVLGLFKFYGDYSNQWTVLAAGIVIVAIPPMILYISLQRYFVEGAVAGAVKA